MGLVVVGLAQPRLVFSDSVRSVYVYQLANGLTVVVSPNKAEPRAFVMIAVRAGSKQDPPDNTGLAHYLEHLLFKGTDRYGTKNYAQEKPYLDAIEALYEQYNQTRDSVMRSRLYQQIDSVAQLAVQWAIPNEYDRMVSAIGAQGTNAFTSFDVTAYINDVPAHQVEALLRLEAERFRYPVLRLFHTELEAVYEEKNIAIDNDNRELSEKVMAALFPDHPYGTQTTIGTIEHLKNPSIRAIRRYYETYYVPNNMAVIVAGDVDPQKVALWVERYFGGFSSKPVPPFPHAKGAPPPPRKKPIQVEAVGPSAPFVELAFRMPPASTREVLILQVLDQILSNSVTGLLDELLVQTHLVKSVGSSPALYADHSVHYIVAEPKPGQTLEDVEKLLWSVIERIKKGQFDERLIEAAINDLDFSRQQSWRSNRQRASLLLPIFIAQRPWHEALQDIQVMRTITKADIVAFAKKYYVPGRVVVGYKRQGPRPSLPKVPKPPITPLQIARGDVSSFAQQFLSEQGSVVGPKPDFMDFSQVLMPATILGKVNFYALRNTDDSLFTLVWYLPLGSWHDKWLPMLFSYLEEVGPAGMGVQAFKRALFQLGARLSFSVEAEQSYITLQGLSRNFIQSVALVQRLLANPEVNEQTWAFIRSNTLKNREDAKKNPATISRMLALYGLYGPRHPQTFIPTQAELMSLSAQQVVAHLTQLWRYPWELYYDGLLAASEVAKQLETVLAISDTWQAPPAPQAFSFQETPGDKALFVHFPMVRAELRWVQRSVPYQEDLRPYAQLFTEYFGSGMSSVVFQQIREAKGLAYSSGAYYAAPSNPRLPYHAFGYISTQADKLPDAYRAMEVLWDSLAIDERPAEVARQALLAQMATERLRHEAVFSAFWQARCFGKRYDLRADVYKALFNLKATDLTWFYQRYIQGQPRLLLVVGDRERLPLAELQKQNRQIREVSLEEVFGY